MVATCGNGSPQSGRLFNWERTMLSIAYSYDILVRRFFITCLSNTYLAFRFSINILLFGMGIDLLKYCISWCPWQRRVEVRLKYMSG